MINIITFIIYGIDKWKAMNEKWRISEKALLGFALCGGAMGAFIGMQVFRHKTKKMLFKIMIPILLVLNFFILFIVLI